MYATRCAQDTARDAVQIFGGRGITRTGMGRVIEHVRTDPYLGSGAFLTLRFSSSTTVRSHSILCLEEVSVIILALCFSLQVLTISIS